MAAAPPPDGAGVHYVEIPIDDRPHRMRLRGELLQVSMTAAGNAMRLWIAAHAAGPERARTFQVYRYRAGLLGRQQELPGDAVLRCDSGLRSDGWRWCRYELMDGR